MPLLVTKRIWPADARPYSARKFAVSTCTSSTVSTSCAPSIDPDDRVRVATAPSIVTRYSSSRPPLMLKLPLLTLSGSNVPMVPPRTPGFSEAR